MPYSACNLWSFKNRQLPFLIINNCFISHPSSKRPVTSVFSPVCCCTYQHMVNILSKKKILPKRDELLKREQRQAISAWFSDSSRVSYDRICSHLEGFTPRFLCKEMGWGLVQLLSFRMNLYDERDFFCCFCYQEFSRRMNVLSLVSIKGVMMECLPQIW